MKQVRTVKQSDLPTLGPKKSEAKEHQRGDYRSINIFVQGSTNFVGDGTEFETDLKKVRSFKCLWFVSRMIWMASKKIYTSTFWKDFLNDCTNPNPNPQKKVPPPLAWDFQRAVWPPKSVIEGVELASVFCEKNFLVFFCKKKTMFFAQKTVFCHNRSFRWNFLVCSHRDAPKRWHLEVLPHGLGVPRPPLLVSTHWGSVEASLRFYNVNWAFLAQVCTCFASNFFSLGGGGEIAASNLKPNDPVCSTLQCRQTSKAVLNMLGTVARITSTLLQMMKSNQSFSPPPWLKISDFETTIG